MLSGVLSSQRAILVNIQIMRAYSRIRAMLITHQDLLLKMEELERRVTGQDGKVALVFDYLRQFIRQKAEPCKQIGYKLQAGEGAEGSAA